MKQPIVLGLLKRLMAYGAFAHAAVLPPALAHGVHVNEVVMGSNGQEVSIWRHRGVTGSGVLHDRNMTAGLSADGVHLESI